MYPISSKNTLPAAPPQKSSNRQSEISNPKFQIETFELLVSRASCPWISQKNHGQDARDTGFSKSPISNLKSKLRPKKESEG
jgi:hypothetical protein